MRFRVLGPLLVEDEAGGTRSVAGARQRVLLAALLVRANCVVPARELADIVWDGAPPAASAALPTQVMRLRRTLDGNAGSLIVTRESGYAITVDEDEFDATVFEALYRNAGAAARAGQWPETADAAGQALTLWRGEALADVDSSTLRQEYGDRWTQLRLQTIEWRVEAELHLGHHDQLVPELRDLSQRHPLREHFHAQLMLALYRCGRQAEALDVYRTAHRILVEDLGVEPGKRLRDLHRQILAGDPAVLMPMDDDAATGTAAHSPAVVPQQLPASSPYFTGRTDELETLTALAGQAAAGTVIISAIDGMAGIGKTALAVHAAHQLADQFPDGVLFTDLHGFTSEVDPTPPEQVLDHLLRGLGVPGPQIPPDLDGRVGLYRSVLARRRVLIVLDNAAHETQVQHLLPGTPGCRTIVTSRRHLAGLDDATHLTLPLLNPAAAGQLFQSLAGDRVVPTDQDTIGQIVSLCGRLPLAIRIAAARLRMTPVGTPATLYAELEHALQAGQGLDWLCDGHRAVTAALAVSYQHLTPGQQNALRLAGLHPGANLEPYALASLADTTLDQARRLLEDLHAARLLDQPTHRRYTMHDLVAAYAVTLANELPEPHRRAALDRLYNYYAAASAHAVNLTYPWDADHQPDPPTVTTPAPTLLDREQAQHWLDTETDNLLAAAHHATTNQRADHTLHQSAALHLHLRTRGHYSHAVRLHLQALKLVQDTCNHAAERDVLNRLGHMRHLQGQYELAADYHERALEIARRTGHRGAEQEALNGLGLVYRVQGRYGPATSCYEQALCTERPAGHSIGEQDALRGLGNVHYLQGRHGAATDCFEQALRIARRTGHRTGEQQALRGLGNVYYVQGRYGPAGTYYEKALAMAHEIGDSTGVQQALRGLGNVHYLQGRYGPATDCYEQALDIVRRTGSRGAEPDALRGLGHVQYLQGRYGPATDYYEQALTIARQTGHRNAQFEAHYGLGRVQHACGEHHNALHHQQAALQLAFALDQLTDQARANESLACTHLALGHPGQARRHWQAALDLLIGVGSDLTEEPGVTIAAIRAHLAHLDDSAG